MSTGCRDRGEMWGRCRRGSRGDVREIAARRGEVQAWIEGRGGEVQAWIEGRGGEVQAWIEGRGGEVQARIEGRCGRGAGVDRREMCARLRRGGERLLAQRPLEPLVTVAPRGRACCLKVETPQLWGGLRRAPEATVSLQDAQAALWAA